MEDTTVPPASSARSVSRRSLLKGSMTLTAAALAAPALSLGVVETAAPAVAPAVERAALAVEDWLEVGGI